MTSPPPSILRPHSLFLTLSQYHPVSLAIALPLSCPLAHVSASSRASERTCMRAFPFPPCTCSALASSLTDQAMDLTLKTETVTLNQRDFETVTVTCVTLTYDARWMECNTIEYERRRRNPPPPPPPPRWPHKHSCHAGFAHILRTSLVPERGRENERERARLLYSVHYRNQTSLVPGRERGRAGERKSSREGALTFLKNSLEHVTGFSYGFRV